MKRPGSARYIGDAIRIRREFYSLSQRGLGAKIGTTQNVVSRHERGVMSMSVDTLLRYCEVLHMQVTINGPVIWIDSEEKIADVG